MWPTRKPDDRESHVWQLQVLELTSGREIALSERRSIDDQLEWLDDLNVLYSVPSADDDSSPSTNVWVGPRRYECAAPVSQECRIHRRRARFALQRSAASAAAG